MKCTVCGQMLGESDKGRKMHMKRYHNVAVLEKPKFPPKAETVAKWESEHPEFFVGLGEVHPEECKCYPACFQKALDRLVAKTEAAANDTGNGFGVNDELASDELSERSSTDGFNAIQHFDGR